MKKNINMNGLIATRHSDSKLFAVWKYLHGVDGDMWVWCRGLEGKLLVGRDCKVEFI